MDIKKSVEATKRNFEESFKEKEFYNKQTQDAEHIKRILNCIELPKDGMKVLDIGTGSGYLAFEVAKNNPKAKVTGLDIVEKALAENRKRAENEKINNVDFVSYEGITFPFKDNTFHYVTARYCLHHFPDIQHTFNEAARVLKYGGKFFLADPTPNENDKDRFVDEYMQMKKDGHIKFYTFEEFTKLAENAGFTKVKEFETSITFPKKKEGTKELSEILTRHTKEVVEGYNVKIKEEEVYITERVANVMFQKGEK